MQRADTTQGQLGAKRNLHRSATESGRIGDIGSKPQRPKKPQKLSGWKPKVVFAEYSQQKAPETQRPPNVEHIIQHPNVPELEATPMAISQQRSVLLPAGIIAQDSYPSTQNYRASYAASANDSVHSEAGKIELLRVRSMILEAGFEFPDLRGRGGETTEDVVLRLLEQHRRLNIALQESYLCLAESKSKPTDAATVSATEEALRNAKDQIRHVKNEPQGCEAAVQDKTKSVSEAEALIKTIASKHGADIKKYHNKIKDLETQLGASEETIAGLKKEQRTFGVEQTVIASQRRKTEELERLVASLQVKNAELISANLASRKQEADALRKEGSALKEVYERQLSDLRGEFFMKTKNDVHLHKKAIEGLQAKLKDERSQLTGQISALEKEIKSVLKTHREILQKERTKSEDIIEQYERMLDRERMLVKEAQKGQEQRRADEQRRMEKELRKQEESLKVQHEQEQFRLRSAVEDLKGALVVKEQFKGLADSDITSRFTKLAQEVEDFARLEWDPEREVHWSEQLQQLHPRNTRKLKQALVRNSVWIGLRVLVFRSPFEMFAEEEGYRELNKQWVDIYTLKTSPTEWPKATKDTEKLRYEGAKQLRAAVAPAVKAGMDPFGEMKMKYEELVIITANAIALNVEKVASLKEKDRKSLHKIVRMSAELWLECCSQRYRLLVTLASGVEDVLSHEQLKFKAVKLVFRPELRRFGNAHGDRMELEEPVTGWRSVVETYPPQRAVIG